MYVSRNGDERTTLGFGLDTYPPQGVTPFGPDARERDPGSTIRPEVRQSTDTAGQRAVLNALQMGRAEPALHLRETIGQGGMGVVNLAEQVSLGRTVAVKRLKDGYDSDGHVLALLREAWITGSLEHPNVVPVHDVGLDPGGRPYLVMKRIEGLHWGRLLRDEAAVRERFGVTDVFAWHLGVLMQVCNAVHFAHDRGVIHRDLKPENVMVGAFGEVYVVDWGVAVALDDDHDGRMPLARDVRSIAGTPAYMAPEMATGGALGPHTDIYLLGSVLFELLTGRPPHSGLNAQAAIEAVRVGLRRRPEGPPDLVDLCVRAMATDPAVRPESARAFRLALQAHLDRRGAAKLAEEATLLLERLEQDLADPTSDPETLWRTFGEVRFGFRQAIRVWPEHADSRNGLTRAVAAMATWELGRGDAHSAAHLVAEPDTAVDPGLAARIRAEVERIDRTLADRDPIRGLRSRWFVAVLLGAVWTAFPLMAWFSERVPDYEKSIRTDATFAVMALVLGILAHRSLLRTTFNRRTWALLQFAPVCNVILAWGSRALGVPIEAYMVFQLFVWMMLAVSASLMIEWRLWPAAIAYLVGFVVAAQVPGTDTLVSAVGNGVLTASLALAWWPGSKKAETAT